ncbi:MAG: DNA repair protein RadA [Pseudomonadota bacterium]
MAKTKTTFVCQSCGAVTSQWAGRCGSCGEWNSIIEEAAEPLAVPGVAAPTKKGNALTLEGLEGDFDETPRIETGMPELDRVLGGGLVAGSAILIGGEPGIGKSTILLQMAAALANAGRSALYFTGEEALAQIRMRAARLGLQSAPVELAAETNLAHIVATLKEARDADLVIIDSIQTLWSDALDAAPGTVSQVRAATQMLVRHAKRTGAALLLVGHVTKEGQIAGPKVVEHMVDTVLYFEGDRGRPFRILRTVKNRFGATDEIGVFEMGERGLQEVANPSALFLGEREAGTPGAAVYAGMEGTRPILVEIQALVTPSSLGTPRRAVVGWDGSRLSMLLAVLEARCGVNLSGHDVYLNVAGGLKITETAADLAAAAALMSSLTATPLSADTVFFGEISLSGGVRATGHTLARLKEAQKLGFSAATLPTGGDVETKAVMLELERLSRLVDLAQRLGASGLDRHADS